MTQVVNSIAVPAPSRGRAVLGWALGAIGLLTLSLVAWGFSSPVGSSPDDDFHLASIWCAQGARADACTPGATALTRRVPSAISQSICFAYVPDRTGDCQGADLGSNPNLVETARGNFAGLYPPGFYAVMSIFVQHSFAGSVLMMRTTNALIAGLILASLLLAARPESRARIVGSFFTVMVPLGMFIVPSTNPSSWAVLGVGGAGLAILEFFETTTRARRIDNALIAIAAGSLAALARGDAGVFVAIATGVAAIATVGHWRAKPALLIVPAGLALMGGAAFALSGQSQVTQTGLEVTGSAVSANAGQGFGIQQVLANLVGSPELVAGALGTAPLGWLDTELPGSVSMFTLLVFGGVIFFALTRMRGWAALSAGLTAAALIAIPVYVLSVSRLTVGQGVQPRYLLPLLVVLAALLWGAPGLARVGPTPLIASALAISLANALALYATLNRFLVGASRSSLGLGEHSLWWWAGAPGPLVVWVIGSGAFLAAAACAVVAINSSAGELRHGRHGRG